MKPTIHPQYYPNAGYRCACGATFNIGSTKESFTIEICSNCHPFYTGKQKLIDTAGRVDKFMARQKVGAQKKAELEDRMQKKFAKAAETLEEKMTRKAQENTEAKEAERAERLQEEREMARKKAEKFKVMPKPKAAKKPVAKAPAAKKTVSKAKKPTAQKPAPKKGGKRK